MPPLLAMRVKVKWVLKPIYNFDNGGIIMNQNVKASMNGLPSVVARKFLETSRDDV